MGHSHGSSAVHVLTGLGCFTREKHTFFSSLDVFSFTRAGNLKVSTTEDSPQVRNGSYLSFQEHFFKSSLDFLGAKQKNRAV